jgi:hypothetical protein
MLEIMTVDRTYRCDTPHARSESPFQKRRGSLAATLYGDFDSVGRLRVFEPESVFLPDRMAGELCRDGASRNRRKCFRVITAGLLYEFARVALPALLRPNEIVSSKRDRR